MKRSLLFAAALFAFAACSSDPEDAAPIEVGGGAVAPAAPQDCFSPASVSGFTTVDSDTIRIEVGADATYEIDAGGAQCMNLGFANQIALQPEATSSSICVADGALAGRIRTDQGDDCAIQSVRRIGAPTMALPVPVTN